MVRSFCFCPILTPMQPDLLEMEMTVSQITALIKTTLEEGFYGLKVTGEISDFRPSSSGHWFFSLKDNEALIGCVMYKGKLWRIPFTPKNGDKVVVSGHLDVWAKRGSYQIVCDTVSLVGDGDLLAQIEARKQKYYSMGYFDQSIKKTIPLFPKKVGVVTSPTGAALRDILQILQRRAPWLDVVILPCLVQGENAAPTIAQRIGEANLFNLCDLLIVGRGGGSAEDLAPFSEECVIEAIHDSAIPTISGVGHEIDWALSDFAADMRAPTPSAAAELASKGYYDLKEQSHSLQDLMNSRIKGKLIHFAQVLNQAKTALQKQSVERKIEEREWLLTTQGEELRDAMGRMFTHREHQIELLASTLKRHNPKEGVKKLETELAHARQLAQIAMSHSLERLDKTLYSLHAKLDALSPLDILKRGYSVVRGPNGKLISHVGDAVHGMEIDIRLQDGHVAATVKESI